MSALASPEIDRLFHALGDPTRRAILDRLTQAPSSASGLAGPLGVTLTAIGQHLSVLEASGLARTEKQGRVRTCTLETAGFDRLQHWINEHRTTWSRRLDALGDLLDKDEAHDD